MGVRVFESLFIFNPHLIFFCCGGSGLCAALVPASPTLGLGKSEEGIYNISAGPIFTLIYLQGPTSVLVASAPFAAAAFSLPSACPYFLYHYFTCDH